MACAYNGVEHDLVTEQQQQYNRMLRLLLLSHSSSV